MHSPLIFLGSYAEPQASWQETILRLKNEQTILTILSSEKPKPGRAII